MRGADPTAVHAIDGSLHTGELADAQIPTTITRDSEWSAIDFLTVSAQAALSAERALTPGASMSPLGWQVRNAAIDTVNNSVTLVNAAELSFSLPTSVSIWVDMQLRVATSVTADIRLAWSLPAGAAFRGIVEGGNQALAIWDGSNTVFASGSANEVLVVRGILTVGGTSGTAQLQFAQGTAEVSDTSIQADSVIIAFRTL